MSYGGMKQNQDGGNLYRQQEQQQVTTGEVTSVKDLNLALDYFLNSTILTCSKLFDIDDHGNHTALCDSVMSTIDKKCREMYFSICFGRNWINYDLVKHKNPDFCSRVDC